MNIRKNIDYSEMYAALDSVVESSSEQMNMYACIGRIVSDRAEKGAAVAAAEYLQENYTNIQGFSPRNLRRMRDFYNAYSQDARYLELAMQIGWTQNVVILEAGLNAQERIWYLKQVATFDWSKKVLIENIHNAVHLNAPLDYSADPCYNDTENIELESQNEENCVHQPDGIASESGRENDRRTVQARLCLHYENRPPVEECRLRQLRPPDWCDAGRLAGYVPHIPEPQ